MANEECYIQDPKTGLFKGSKPGCSRKTAKAAFVEKLKAAVKKKKEQRPEVYHTELTTPDNYKGDLNKLREENLAKSREALAKGGVTYPDKDVAKYQGDGYWTGQASEYKPTGKRTARGDKYKNVPNGVAINRAFGYQTEPKTRDNFVVVGDMGKNDGKIEIRPVRDTGMFASYIDKNGVRQKYPHPTNLVDLH